MKLPPDPYGTIPTADRVKLQSYVPEAVKDRLMLVIPNRDLYTLLINHALRRTVEFIDTNSLSYSKPGDSDRLLAYIISGTDGSGPACCTDDRLHQHPAPCTPGDTIPRNGPRVKARVRTASKNAKD